MTRAVLLLQKCQIIPKSSISCLSQLIVKTCVVEYWKTLHILAMVFSPRRLSVEDRMMLIFAVLVFTTRLAPSLAQNNVADLQALVVIILYVEIKLILFEYFNQSYLTVSM